VFSLPGICGLIFFVLARPQEAFPQLQRLPFLYLFCAMAIGGLILDLKLRRLEPITAPNLPWAVLFLVWVVICDAVVVPAEIVSHVIDVAIIATLYTTIAHGIQRFRALQLVAGVTMVTCLGIAFVCWDQGLHDRSCVAIDENQPGEGTPEDRPCDMAKDCYTDDAEPGADYRCEKVGMFGTYSIEDRVRYRGDLHDPNEVSLTICVGGLAFAIAFALRRRTYGAYALAGLASGLVLWTVLMTQSRGGLVVMMAVPAVYLVNRYGWKMALLGAMVAIPVLMFGGRGGESAEESTFFRYEAWAAGLQMFKQSPIFGVGHRMFGDHFFITAHNSYVLTLAEVGGLGFFLFVTMVFMSVKTVYRGVRELATEPGAAVARTWGLALLASMAGLVFQINTLSFAYHSVIWLFFGLVGAWYSAVRHHRPELKVTMTLRDVLTVAVIVVVYGFVALPVFLRIKHIT